MSALGKTFRKLSGGAMALSLVAFPMVAHANDSATETANTASTTVETVIFAPLPKRETPYCAANEKNKHGLEMGASATAMEYSAENYGSVGIYIAPGNDLNGYTPEQLGQHLVNYFAEEGIEAECFISDRQAANGTALDFKVNNLSWGEDRRLNLQQAMNTDTLKNIVASARVGKERERIIMASNLDALNP